MKKDKVREYHMLPANIICERAKVEIGEGKKGNIAVCGDLVIFLRHCKDVNSFSLSPSFASQAVLETTITTATTKKSRLF